MKNTSTALVLSALLLGAASAASAAPPDAYLVVPGHRIGHTLLGSDGTRALASLPKPTRSEGATSNRYYVWNSPAAQGQPHTLFVHGVDNRVMDVKPHNGLTIDTVRVTSPAFATQRGLHVGSTFAQIQRRFPHLRSVNSAHTLYDDKARGIAFEFARRPDANTRALAVTVHTPGQAATITASEVN